MPSKKKGGEYFQHPVMWSSTVSFYKQGSARWGAPLVSFLPVSKVVTAPRVAAAHSSLTSLPLSWITGGAVRRAASSAVLQGALWSSHRTFSSSPISLDTSISSSSSSSCSPSCSTPTTAVGGEAQKKEYKGPLTIGDPGNGKLQQPIRVTWTDLVGLDSAPAGTRLSGGRVLAMLDMCAARASQEAASFAMRHENYQQRYLSCTVGVTNTMFASPILHGDMVRLDGRVIHCGASSVGIHITFYRRSFRSRKETIAGESFFTMVTITPDLKAARIVPAMDLTDPNDIEMHYRYLNIREMSKEAEQITATRRAMQSLKYDEVDCSINKNKPLHVRIEDTKMTANRIFFSSCLNNNNTVFGGELMSWMERHAVHCGRCFTGNRHVYCIGMHSVAFPQPVFATDWVTLEARVIYVRNTTMEVDVTLRAERKDQGDVITNKASFVMINSNDIRMKTDIPIGILLDETTSQEELQLFMEAKERYHRSIARSANFKKKFQSNEVIS